jgi:IS4 transposase
MPLDIGRVPTESSDSQVGAEQVAALAEHNSRPKVVVADSLYCNVTFLAIFLTVQCVYALVRIRSNRVLYEEPPERQPGQRGRSRKHGPKFKLSAPSRTPDRAETCTLLGQQVRLLAWTNLHFYQLPFLVGMVLSVQFLKADGTPRFKRPLYLFWTGPTSVALADLARIYLWRFAIEHMFRFLKQHLGLTASNSPNLQARLRWVWCCALASCQLLFIRHKVADRRPPWHPTYVRGKRRPLTPRQVQRNALPFLLELGSPARPTQPAGKGSGRPPGYRPEPRKRHPVVKKSKKRPIAA